MTRTSVIQYTLPIPKLKAGQYTPNPSFDTAAQQCLLLALLHCFIHKRQVKILLREMFTAPWIIISFLCNKCDFRKVMPSICPCYFARRKLNYVRLCLKSSSAHPQRSTDRSPNNTQPRHPVFHCSWRHPDVSRHQQLWRLRSRASHWVD